MKSPFSTSMIGGSALVLLLLFSLQACSLKSNNDDSNLYLDLSALKGGGSRHSLMNSPQFLNGASLTPTSVSGFPCYGVNVTGPGIMDTSYHPEGNPMAEFQRTLTESNYYCSYRGIVTPPLQLVSGGTEVSLVVPPGPVRLVQIVGVNDQTVCSSGYIGNENDSTVNTSGSRYFELGRAVVNDLVGDRAVSVNLNWPTGNTVADATDRQNRALDCGDGCGSVMPAPTATPSPMPTSAVASGGTMVADLIPTVAGKYIRRVNIFLAPVNAVGGNVTVRAEVRETVSSADPGTTASTFGSTISLSGTSTSTSVGSLVPGWYTFELRDTNVNYLQMQPGKYYWIVVSSSDASAPSTAILPYKAFTGSGNLMGFSGSVWSSMTSYSLVADVAGCDR